MVNNFLDYLRNKALISSQQMDLVTEYVQTATPKYTLIAILSFGFSEEQIEKVNEYLRAYMAEFPSMPFELAAHKLGFLDVEQANLFTQYKDDVEYTHGQLLIDLNILDLPTVCEELLFFKIETSHNENLIDIPTHSEKLSNTFLDEYVQVVNSRILKYFSEHAVVHPIETIDEIQCDVFVYQELLCDSNITTGLVFDYSLMADSDFRLFNAISQCESSPVIDTEDFVDSMCEFLKNTNGTCTYLFSTEFDLGVPMYLEKIIVQSPLMYSIDFAFSSKIIKLIIIPESNYHFMQKEVNE